jgi:hypothetical protein
MLERTRLLLVLHGLGLWVTVILVGWMYMFSLLGEVVLFPVLPSIDLQIPGEARAWNMAHLEGITNGLLLMALAVVAPLLDLSPKQARIVLWSAAITAWGFTLPAWANALVGTRGLAFDGGPFIGGLANNVIYLTGWPAVVAVHVLFAVLLVAGFRRLRAL